MTSSVSIVIPVYNGAKTLRRCLNSVLDQDFTDYEVIVVNNNSLDETEHVIKDFASQFPKIKYVFEPYRSRGAARNTGIRSAQGEIIAMTDCDCIVPTHWLSELIKPIVNENESIVMGGEIDLVDTDWTRLIQRKDEELHERNTEGEHIHFLDTKNFAARKEVFQEFMFDPHIKNLEDFEFLLKIEKKIMVRYLKEVKVGHFHAISLRKWFSCNFDRGYWARKIYENHKSKLHIKDIPILSGMSLRSSLAFPFWIIMQFMVKPFQEACFTFVSEISWRSGILTAQLYKWAPQN